ncbi:MAG: hypothetical protein EXS05_04380 [Planctomycetaceae bacterium]|nr:hypothetical protein [Planctomycetaceae bacterium]
MRYAVVSISLLAALCSTVRTARADDAGGFQQVQYSESFAQPWGDGFDETGAAVDDFGDELSPYDPRYDWQLSEGPVDLNPLFALPQYGSYFQADVLWLSRIHSAHKTVAVTLPPNSKAVLNSSDAGLTDMYRPGALLTLGKRFDQVSAFELTFFGFNEWEGSAQATGNGDLSLPGTLALNTQDFIFANRIKFDYNSSLYNVEANYTQTIAGLILLSGFRYLRLNESFDINSYVANFNQSSDYLVRAKNNLIGGQIGLGFSNQWDRLTVDLLGKFGVYANVAEQNTLMKDLNNTFIRRNFQDHTTAVSVLGEAQLNLSYRVFDWLSIRGGYRFMWINNLALAPNQLNFSIDPGSGQSVDAHDYLYIHGMNVGLEARW